MTMITIYNDFHNTEVNFRITGDGWDWHVLSPAQHRRLRRELCGAKECTCGIVRGPQEVDVDYAADGSVMVRRRCRYTVRRPISSDSDLSRDGMVVSRHSCLDGASRALRRQQAGAAAQGGFSQDYIWDEEYGVVVE